MLCDMMKWQYVKDLAVSETEETQIELGKMSYDWDLLENVACR